MNLQHLIISKFNLKRFNRLPKYYLGNFSYNFNKIIEDNILIKHENNSPIIREKNFFYIRKLKKKILPELMKHLNKIHNTKYDIEFWNIFLGMWLESTLHVLHDRWLFTDRLNKKN